MMSLASMVPVMDPATEGARAITHLIWLVLGISAVIFLITGGLIVLAMLKSNRAQAAGVEHDTPEGAVEHPYREVWWLIGPLLVVIWISYASVHLISSLAVAGDHGEVDPDRAVTAEAVGRQWFWEFNYPEAGFVTANELHLPVGEEAVIRVQATDVIHSFWVPQLGRKIDAIPGRTNYVKFTPEKPGTYQGYCSEFCGTQHAWMLFDVVVHEADDYARWLANQQTSPASSDEFARSAREPAASPPASAATKPATDTTASIDAGRAVFQARTCNTCHAVGHGPDSVRIGPDLTHFASREIFAGGISEVTPEDVSAWMHDPQAVKPGVRMPTFQFTDQELADLTAYLMSLK